MKIETKYDIGQEVWVMSDGKPTKAKIKWIDISVFSALPLSIKYQVLSYEAPRYENQVFESEEELLKSL
jgi:hypothetical protein